MAKHKKQSMEEENLKKSEQKNKRVETKTFEFYEQAAEYKKLQLDSGKYSKVKIILRANSNYNVASFVPVGA